MFLGILTMSWICMKRESHFICILDEVHPQKQCTWDIWFLSSSQSKMLDCSLISNCSCHSLDFDKNYFLCTECSLISNNQKKHTLLMVLSNSENHRYQNHLWIVIVKQGKNWLPVGIKKTKPQTVRAISLWFRFCLHLLNFQLWLISTQIHVMTCQNQIKVLF